VIIALGCWARTKFDKKSDLIELRFAGKEIVMFSDDIE